MINKPVSVIMNASKIANGIYTTANKTLDYFMENASVGMICFIDAATKQTFTPFSGTLAANHTSGIRIYQKISDYKFIRLASQKPLRATDLHNVNYTGCRAGVDQVIEIIPADCYCCNKDYGIRFEINNDEIRMQQFDNMYLESYIVPANKCCGEDCTDQSFNVSDLVKELYKAWRENRKHSMLQAYIASSNGYETGKVIDDDTLDAGTWTKIAFVVKASEMYKYYQMNLKYVKNRMTTMNMTLLEGFLCCKPTVNDSNSESYEDDTIDLGSNETGKVKKYKAAQTYGYDLKQMEWDFMGWMDASPYRLSDVTLSEMGYDYQFKDEDKMYSVLVINYEQQSDAPWGHWQHPEQLVLAAGCTVDSNSESDTYGELVCDEIASGKTLADLAAFFGLTVSDCGDTENSDIQ